MSRLTEWQNGELLVKEEERLLNANGVITKDEMYKIMRHLAEQLADYEDKQEQGLLIELPVPIGTEVYKVVEDKTASTIETIKHNGHEYHRTIPCYFVCRDLFTFSMMKEVGKTVFLTLDEARKAEEALAKMGGTNETV